MTAYHVLAWSLDLNPLLDGNSFLKVVPVATPWMSWSHKACSPVRVPLRICGWGWVGVGGEITDKEEVGRKETETGREGGESGTGGW